jgi:hypothetical protein
VPRMCRSIQPLHRCEVPVTDLDVREAAIQYVRKLSGMRQPSKANAEAFERAVDEVAHATAHLLASLEPAPPVAGRVPIAHKIGIR